MNCQKCGGETWDNTAKVATGWRGPLRKCKNTACDWVLWPPKQKGTNGAPAKVSAPRAKWTWDSLDKTYERCLLVAEKRLTEYALRHPKHPPSAADVASVAATLFIAASRDGIQENTVSVPNQPLTEKPAAFGDEPDGPLPF